MTPMSYVNPRPIMAPMAETNRMFTPIMGVPYMTTRLPESPTQPMPFHPQYGSIMLPMPTIGQPVDLTGDDRRKSPLVGDVLNEPGLPTGSAPLQFTPPKAGLQEPPTHDATNSGIQSTTKAVDSPSTQDPYESLLMVGKYLATQRAQEKAHTESRKQKKSVASSETKSRRKSLDPDDRRLIHNVSERHRRNSIKDGFTELRNRIPALSSERRSKIDILHQGKFWRQSNYTS